ncbi:conserved exported hypothetical protein [Paraburkholderia piptadeniae]|uniref:Lipoprotein n=1 Tax=Paraburkholderia piptadeniae TaxID=1701573 RepID=A0A1N7SEW2_9BURK|nr:hypothetical protein [Paraburkholderia piptadeniae]SIT45917.1 conserved exported hypothetical protein [Paraburkholderia piptadeniae]
MKLEHIAFARRVALVVSLCGALSGCMSSTPIWDKHMGEALNAVKQAQIIDPHAAEHAPSAQGVDGKSAASAMATYDKSFKEITPTPNAYVIGVGNGSGGQ